MRGLRETAIVSAHASARVIHQSSSCYSIYFFRSLAGGVCFAVQISCGMCAEEEAGWTAIANTNELKRVFKLFLSK